MEATQLSLTRMWEPQELLALPPVELLAMVEGPVVSVAQRSVGFVDAVE
jgi:hypothetical protein